MARTAQRDVRWSGIKHDSRGKNLFKLYIKGRKKCSLRLNINQTTKQRVQPLNCWLIERFCHKSTQTQQTFSYHTFLLISTSQELPRQPRHLSSSIRCAFTVTTAPHKTEDVVSWSVPLQFGETGGRIQEIGLRYEDTFFFFVISLRYFRRLSVR